MTDQDYRIRRAVAGDAEAIGAVFDAAVRAGWTFLGEAAQQPMFPPDEWDQLVADHQPPNALLVAVDGSDRIAGYAAVHPDGEMFLLFVDPAHAGRGLGRRLLDAAHDELRALGCTEAYLYTEERNTRAIAVYTAAGYRPDGTARESDFKDQQLREIRMVANLVE